MTDGEDDRGGFYEWTCPICGESNVGVAGGEDALAGARKALRSHVRTNDGGGHGPAYELPEEWPDSLDAYVEARADAPERD